MNQKKYVNGFRRFMSAFLVLVMVFTMLPVAVYAKEAAQSAQVDNDNMTIQGTNGFGNLLSDAMTQEQEDKEETSSQYDAGYGITDLEIADNVATVSYYAAGEAILIVTLYSEDGLQMLASGKTEVSADDTVATVTIEGTMPEYFMVSAYLVDSYDFSPLCQAYDSPIYTQEMQELLASTIHDYDPEKVLNLDEDETTNFAVFADTTMVITYVEGCNIVASANDETLTYVIENADEQFTSLKEGDVVFYGYGEGELLLVKVASIVMEGSTVSITGDKDISLEDVFDYMKIEILADNSDLEEIEDPAGNAEQNSSARGVVPTDNETEIEVKPIRYDFIGEEAKYFDGYIEILLKNETDFYYSKGRTTFRWELSYSISGDFTVKVEKKDEDKEWVIPILKDFKMTKLSAVGLIFSPDFVFKASGSFTVKTTLSGSIGIDCATGRDPINISKPMDMSDQVNLEGKIFFGFDLEPRFYVLHEKIFYIEMGVPFGANITGEMSGETVGVKGTKDELHECDLCIKGEIYGSIGVEVAIKFFDKKNIELGGSITKKFLAKPFYWSLTHGEFGWGSCPYQSYKVTIAVLGENNRPMPDVDIWLSNGTVLTTGKNGAAVIYLPNGTYSAHELSNEITPSTDFTVAGNSRSVVLYAAEKEPENGLPDAGDSEIITDPGPDIASGVCGENVSWVLKGDGTFILSGTGNMNDHNWWWEGAPWNRYVSRILKVEIEEGITGIPDDAFSGCFNLISVSIPEGVINIGECAFAYCRSLTEIFIPASVSELDGAAFSGCTNLQKIYVSEDNPYYANDDAGIVYNKEKTSMVCVPGGVSGHVTIPDGVTMIDHEAFRGRCNLTGVTIPDSVTYINLGAFYDCDGLTEIIIPDSVTVLREYVFSYCSSLTRVELSNNINYIAYGLFNECKNLSEVVIPAGVTYIGGYAFSQCPLTEIDLPDGLESIGERAFQGCANLVRLDFPETLKKICEDAFHSCKSVTEMIFRGDAPSFEGDWGEALTIFCSVTATAYYPANNPTWTADVMKSYGGTLTWVPYTMDEDGTMIIHEEAAVMTEPELPVNQSDGEVQDRDREEPTESLTPDAVYGGEYSTEITDEYTLKTASFKNLIPGGQYLLLAMKSVEGEDPLAADNLLYVAQGQAGEDGTLVFTYVQREAVNISYVVACGPSSKDLKDAVITFPEMTADGELQVVNPTVVYDGKTLTEGRDYIITGTVSFTEAGTYTCYIQGVHDYTGTVECVWEAAEEVPEYKLGDADGNGTINTIDAMLVMQYFARLITVDKLDVRACDVDGNGVVNTIDAMLIMQYFAKLISKFPAEG